MALPQGVDFRNTTGFVADPANCGWIDINSSLYPRTSPQGNTWGVLNGTGISTNTFTGAIDRSSSVDPRLAGIWYVFTASGTITAGFEIDLPSAGTYSVNLALGDEGSGNGPFSVFVYDGLTTPLQTIISNQSQSTGQWYDATGTLRTSAAAWVTANPQGGGGSGAISLSFTTTKMVVYVQAANPNIGPISHIWVMTPAGVAVPSATALFVLP